MFKSFKEQKELKKKAEGKVVELPDEKEVLEVSTEPVNTKIEKDNKNTFEEFKILYKGQIDDKCLEDYGTIEDKKLWEDTAKELFMASEDYIPDENDKTEKIEESKLLEDHQLYYDDIQEMSSEERHKLWMTEHNEDYKNEDDFWDWAEEEFPVKEIEESKKLNEKDLGNNTYTDIDEAEYYRNKELYYHNQLARYKDAMEKARRACKKKGIKLKEESKSERYQVREFDGSGAKFGVFDTKEKKFVQKGSKYVMDAACKDLNEKGKVTESSIIKYTLKEMMNKKQEAIEEGASIFELKFDCSNEDTFGIGYELENSISDILYKVADKVKSGMLDSSILDINGNKIGSYGLGYEGVQSGLTEATDADIEAAKKDSKEKGLYCEDKNDSVYYTYSIYTMNDENDTWTWKDSFESEGIADKKEAEEKAKAKVKELKDSGEFYDVSYKEWENDREEDKKYDIDISRYNTIDKIKARVKEINDELAYCRRRDRVCATFGGDQQVYDLKAEREKLKAKLAKLKKAKKTESSDDIPNITWILDNYDWEIDIVTKEDLGSDYYYRTLCTTVNDAERFNYHSDYWGDADTYQQDNIDLMEQVEPYVGKEVIVDFDDDGEVHQVVYKILGIVIDKQYNSLSHTNILAELVREIKTEDHQLYYDDIQGMPTSERHLLWKQYHKEDFEDSEEGNDKFWDWAEEEFPIKELNEAVEEEINVTDANEDINSVMIVYVSNQTFMKYYNLQKPLTIEELKSIKLKIKNHEMYVTDIKDKLNATEVDSKKELIPNTYIMKIKENDVEDLEESKQDKCAMCGSDNLNGCFVFKSNNICKECGKKYSLEEIEDKLKAKDIKTESQVSDYTFKELNKVINDKGNDFKIQISGSEDKTNWLNIDKEDLQAIYQALQNKNAK